MDAPWSGGAASHLGAPEAAPVVALLAEPLHEFDGVGDQAERVVRQQHVGRQLDVRRAGLP